MHRTLNPWRKLLSGFDPQATHNILDETSKWSTTRFFKMFDLNRVPGMVNPNGRANISARNLGNDRYGRPDLIRDLSSVGRATARHAVGHRFEPCRSHHFLLLWHSW